MVNEHNKRILLTPKDKENDPPKGLNAKLPFKRLGILNPAVLQHGPMVYLLSRLFYNEAGKTRSCIVRNAALLEGDSVRVIRDREGTPIEDLVLAPGPPHGDQGVEDMRVGYIQGEAPLHSFLVHYNGLDARTEYLRTKEAEPKNLLKWDRFDIFFPNISLNEALELAPNRKYKDFWMPFDSDIVNQPIPREEYSNPQSPFLGTKDCALIPHKIKKNGEDHYGVIIRLLPDMQIVYVKDFKDLAKHEFWQNTVRNLESHILLERENDWEESHIGLGSSPFEISDGVVIPYHGVKMEPERDYKFGAVLVDKEDPQKILGRTKKPILEATEAWEKNGVVDGKIVFPTGNVVWDGFYHIFYGAGDKFVGHVTIPEKRLLDNFN